MRHLLALAAVLAIGCAGPDAPTPAGERAPLIGGELSHDPSVVALARAGSTSSFCSGTLISPSVVMTAAHCIDMASAEETTVLFGDDTHGAVTRIGVRKTQQRVGWNGLNTGAQDFDLGLVLLNFPQDPELAAPVNTTPATDLVGSDYRVVGFGVYDQATQDADGKKREGTVVIDQAIDPPASDDIIIRDTTTIICFGDSGGPGFVTIDGVDYVAGVHSWTTGSNCGPPNGDTRVDLYAAEFVLPWIQANDPACGMDGTCARIGCMDDPDCLPCGPDGTCHTDCPLPDYDCRTQDLGEICQVDSQCLSDLCVFWQSDLSTHFCSQTCSGNGDCPDGMSCQSVQPFGMICYYDEPPPGVVGSACSAPTDCGSYKCVEDVCVTTCDLSVGVGCAAGFECRASGDDYYCFAADSGGGGGCRAAGAGAAPLFGLAVFLLVAIGRRKARGAARR